MNRTVTFFPARALGVLGVAAAFHATCALAQDRGPELPPPKDPVLPRAPARAEWTATTRADRKKALEEMAAPPKGNVQEKATKTISEIRVSKDGSLYRELSVLEDGRKIEKWISGIFQAVEAPVGGFARIPLPAGTISQDYSDYRAGDFENLLWVDKSNYAGSGTFQGLPVYVFKVAADKRLFTPREKSDLEMRRTPDDSLIRKPGQTFVAYLDARTQLPVLFDDGESVTTYSFIADPPDKLQAPPAFAKALADWTADVKRKSSKPLPP